MKDIATWITLGLSVLSSLVIVIFSYAYLKFKVDALGTRDNELQERDDEIQAEVRENKKEIKEAIEKINTTLELVKAHIVEQTVLNKISAETMKGFAERQEEQGKAIIRLLQDRNGKNEH